MKTRYLIYISILVIVASCAPYEETLYFKENGEKTGQYYHPFDLNYKIKPGDVLSIDITTGDEELDEKFKRNGDRGNSSTQNMSGGTNAGYLYRSGYSVNDLGMIELPILGEFNAAGESIHNIHKLIKEKLTTYIEGGIVKVDLVTTRFTTLGAVNEVGIKYVFEKKLNIYEAISLSGDIPYEGKKQIVNIVRKDNEGIKKITLDLTKMNAVESEGFYIANDDIIYVEPYKFKVVQTNVRDVIFYSSTITSALSLIILVINLKN